MDNILVKSRYPRNSIAARRKKKNFKETGTYRDKLAKQMVISVMILMVAGIVKNSNTTATNFISSKMRVVLSQNVELQSVYQGIESIINQVLKKDSQASNRDQNFNEEAAPVNGMAYNQEQLEGNASNNENAQRTSTPVSEVKSSTNTAQVQPKDSLPDAEKSMFITPVVGPLSSPYGNRVSPSTGKEQFHRGIDIEAKQGAEIKSASAGTVIESGYDKNLGNYLKIAHENEMNTVYGHCSQLLAKKGQKIKQGDIVAKVGSTGLSTGAHLHFEIWKDGKSLNPLDYVKVSEK